jgi:hypothetical protein
MAIITGQVSVTLMSVQQTNIKDELSVFTPLKASINATFQ